MFVFGASSQYPDDSAESFIGENLSIYQAKWLTNQCNILQQTRSQILEAILREWLLDHPNEDWQESQAGEVARRAVSEFILRHYKEFLPVPPST
jgi:3-methyladenine DNA glycosylase AlkC